MYICIHMYMYILYNNNNNNNSYIHTYVHTFAAPRPKHGSGARHITPANNPNGPDVNSNI